MDKPETREEKKLIRLQTAPYQELNIYTRPGNWALEEHDHDYHQYLVVTQGILKLRISHREYQCRSGNLIYIPPFTSHSLYSETGYSQLGINCQNAGDDRGILKALDQLSEAAHIPIPYQLYNRIIEFSEALPWEHPLKRLEAFNLADQITIYLCRTILLKEDHPFSFWYPRIQDYLQRHRHSKFLLRDASHELGISIPHLERLAKKFFNHGLIEEFLELKADKACLELIESDRQIAEIADSLGFSSSAYFSKFFSSRIGVSPRKYRERYRGG